MTRLASFLLTSFLICSTASAQYTPDGEAYNRSYGAEAMGDYPKALKELDALTAGAKRAYIYQLRRGWLLYLSARYTDSMEAYRKAGEIHPNAIEPILGEMLPLMALRRWKDALNAAARVEKAAPNNTTALSRKAWCEYNLGRFHAAASSYRKVLRLFPADLEMRAGLGWALLKQAKKAEAINEFSAILAVAPGHASAQQGIAAASK